MQATNLDVQFLLTQQDNLTQMIAELSANIVSILKKKGEFAITVPVTKITKIEADFVATQCCEATC
jgi:hypothetical protein